MKIAICTPVHGDTKARFTLCLADMLCWSLTKKVTYNGSATVPEVWTNICISTSRVDAAREALAEEALRNGADYLLWLDADQTFPVTTMFRLMSHDLPLVGANYRKRLAGEVISTAGMFGANGLAQPIAPKPDGLEEVDMIGFGVTLTKAALFREMPRPWFRMERNGEDGYFCEKAGKLGVRPVVDHALSKEIGHVAETVLML